MPTLFKSGEISKRLQITTHTIRRWVHRYPDFFSQEVQESKYHVGYNAEDVLIIGTIHHLSQEGHGMDEIEAKLKEGFRYQDDRLSPSSSEEDFKFDGDNGKIPKAIIVELKLTRIRLEEALEEKKTALQKYEQQQEIIANLMRENSALQYRLGVAEGELNLLRRQTSEILPKNPA